MLLPDRRARPLVAQLEPGEEQGNRRAATRRIVRLKSQGAIAPNLATDVVVHDLSRTGLLIETTADIAPGERLEVDLPEAGLTEAIVVWSSGCFFGCEFRQPISAAALSSALLRSPSVAPSEGISEEVSETVLEIRSLRKRVRKITGHVLRTIDQLGGRGEK